MDGNVKEAIKTAKINFDKHVGALDQHHLEYFTFTKKQIKAMKLSPDSIMQLAIQVIYAIFSLNRTSNFLFCLISDFKQTFKLKLSS